MLLPTEALESALWLVNHQEYQKKPLIPLVNSVYLSLPYLISSLRLFLFFFLGSHYVMMTEISNDFLWKQNNLLPKT